MCLILFAFQHHPHYPLIVAANRDEFFERPTQASHFWHDAPAMLAGKDLQAGGTWMGLTTAGRFAAVTNYREPREVDANALSRGHLCKEYLQTTTTLDDYLHSLANTGNRYAGFNVLLGDFSRPEAPQLAYFSNRASTYTRLLPAGIHGISNGLLNDPWPKVDSGKAALAMRTDNAPYQLLDILADSQTAEPALLPDTGVEKTLEEQLSARFIKMENYGTRSSTVFRIDNEGKVDWLEQTYGPNASAGERREFHFSLSPD